MKFAISNIAWNKKFDEEMFFWMKENGFSGLEIAPTRVIESEPYEMLDELKIFRDDIFRKYGLQVCSMQSIWFGRKEKLFSSKEEMIILLEYTKKAINFAKIAGCNNLVFGCPKNRVVSSDGDYLTAVEFFQKLGIYASKNNVVIAVEANPVIYNTNFLNCTEEAIRFVRLVNSPGVKVNLDFGTILANREGLAHLTENVDLINHVHISTPGLNPVEPNDLHLELRKILSAAKYQNYVSLEMKDQGSIRSVQNSALLMKETFS